MLNIHIKAVHVRFELVLIFAKMNMIGVQPITIIGYIAVLFVIVYCNFIPYD